MYARVQLCMRGAHTHPVLGVKEAWPDRPCQAPLSHAPSHVSLLRHPLHPLQVAHDRTLRHYTFACGRTLTSEVEDDGEMKSSLSRSYTTNDSLIYLF